MINKSDEESNEVVPPKEEIKDIGKQVHQEISKDFQIDKAEPHNHPTEDSADTLSDSPEAIKKEAYRITYYSNSGYTRYKYCEIKIYKWGFERSYTFNNEEISGNFGKKKDSEVIQVDVNLFKDEFDKFIPQAIAEINEEIYKKHEKEKEEERIEKILHSRDEKYYAKLRYYSAYHYDFDCDVYIFGNSKEEIFSNYRKLFSEEIEHARQGWFKEKRNYSRGEIDAIESSGALDLHDNIEFEIKSFADCYSVKIYKEGEFLDFEDAGGM